MSIDVRLGDCIEAMRTMADNSIDAVITDPPYNLSFMSKEWDHHDSPLAFQQWCQEWATGCLRVLKPGGYLVAAGGTRTFHRLTVGIEDAGFEVRDSIGYGHSLLAHVHGQGFPKGTDVSKAIDKAAGAKRAVIGSKLGLPGYSLTDGNGDHRTYGKGLGNTGTGEAECDLTAPATDDARKWQGWNTSMKPAWEPITLARKPFQGTIAANVLTHGTGALNIDACRIEHADAADLAVSLSKNPGRSDSVTSDIYGADRPQQRVDVSGRWPANVVLDESQAAVLDEQSGTSKDVPHSRGVRSGVIYGGGKGPTGPDTVRGHFDTGGASRFFLVVPNEAPFKYQAKAPAMERPSYVTDDGRKISHATVKPLALMRWLIRLVTPPGGTILDPFAGSGTTLEAALLEGFDAIGIESEADYIPLIHIRLERSTP